MNEIPIGLYKHFKGHTYEVIGLADHSETQEVHVIYRDTVNLKQWIRPLSMFTETVEYNGKQFSRFTRVEDSDE